MTKPRLLTKRELDVAKGRDRAREIQEGKKLADRVDGLRQLAADTEKETEERKSQILASAQAEIDAKTRELVGLDEQIKERRDELTELRKPLDAEWDKLAEERNDLHTRSLQVEEKDMQLKSAIALNIQRERDNEKEAERIQVEKEMALEDRKEAAALKDDAAKRLLSARSEAEQIVSRAKEREEAVEARESSVEKRELDAKKLAARGADMLEQASKEFKKVRDLYATLERNKKREQK